MIKLTKISSTTKDAPSLVLIPGGPGLSSLTLRSMDILRRSFNLIYVDFPGTNDNPYIEDHSFNILSEALASEIKKLNSPVYVLGHSFGGFFVADIAERIKLDGVICVSTPFSEKSLLIAEENYTSRKTPALLNAENEWEKLQNDKSLAKWLSEYGELYFADDSGKELLLEDKVSAKFFLANRSEVSEMEAMLAMLKKNEAKKLFIAGQNDKMLPEDFLKEDSLNGGFKFISIKNASHFVTFDQPELVARSIEDFMRQNN